MSQPPQPGTLGPLFVLSGPSGSGKTTLIRRLLEEGTWPVRLSVSVTTRAKRPREEEGKDYYYWPHERFLEKVKEGAFLEWADVFGNYYGTLRDEVDPYRAQGIGVLLDIDVQGWEQVRKSCPDATSIFVRTSSLATYEERLRKRKTEDEATIQKRLRGAECELARVGEYQYQVINDDVEPALVHLRAIVAKSFRGGERGASAP
jgi:guanylate kinase